MKIVDKYMCKNFIRSFLICLIALEGIFVISQLFRVMRFVSDGKFTGKESLIYIVNMLPNYFIYVAPISVLLGSLLTISTMASNLEIISLKTAGVSFKRIVRYPIIIAAIISIIVFVVNDHVYPKAVAKNQMMRKNKTEEPKRPITKENAFYRGIDGNYVYRMGKINRITGIAEYVEIIDLTDDFTKTIRVITAEKGIYNFTKKVWVFRNVYIHTDSAKTSGEFVRVFSDDKYSEEPDKFITRNIKPDNMTNRQLKRAIREMKNTGGDTRDVMMELGRRYSFPFAAFVIVFLGLSLGSRYVRGTSAISIGLSLCFGYGHYIVTGVFEAISKRGILNPFVSGWLSNILFLAIGIYFMKKAEY